MELGLGSEGRPGYVPLLSVRTATLFRQKSRSEWMDGESLPAVREMLRSVRSSKATGLESPQGASAQAETLVKEPHLTDP